MVSTFKAGLVYAFVVFIFAFLTGALRTLLLAQDFGLTPVSAVLLELPVILVASWVACGGILRRMQIPARIDLRVVMGVVALTTIIVLEFALAAALSGSGLGEFLASYRKPEVILGLIGQLAFAAFPLARIGR